MAKDISKQKAEHKLRGYIQTKYNAYENRTEKSKPFSRLLFQHVDSLANIKRNNPIKAYGKNGISINKNNIKDYLKYTHRKTIIVDAFFKSNGHQGVFYLGEAKGTTDKTGQIPGNTYSCAHKISQHIIQRSQLLLNGEKGYTQSFLSQPLGYLDAVINAYSDINTLNFIWLICDNKLNEKCNFENFGHNLTTPVQ